MLFTNLGETLDSVPSGIVLMYIALSSYKLELAGMVSTILRLS